jgi:hypothetical protein
MLVNFTDKQNGNSVAVNPKFVVLVFTAKDEAGVETTIINTTTGNIPVAESQIDVVGVLQGQLS